MSKLIAIFLLSLTTSAIAKDDGKADIHYAGLGRYTCSGNKYKCAQIEANNRTLEERDRQRWEQQQERDYEQRKRDLEMYGVRR